MVPVRRRLTEAVMGSRMPGNELTPGSLLNQVRAPLKPLELIDLALVQT
jgi:hypothetical protein